MTPWSLWTCPLNRRYIFPLQVLLLGLCRVLLATEGLFITGHDADIGIKTISVIDHPRGHVGVSLDHIVDFALVLGQVE